MTDRHSTLWLADLQSQFRDNARLRVGAWLVIGVLWLYVLLWAGDQVALLSAQRRQAEVELDRQRAVAAQTGWADRAALAQRDLETLRGLMWTESERGLVEAAFQDWVGALAGKVGLNVRERSLLRGDAAASRTAAPSAAPGNTGPALPEGVALVRMRLVFDFDARTLAVFLSEVAQSKQIVRVDRLRVLTTGKPGMVDVELTAVARLARRGAP